MGKREEERGLEVNTGAVPKFLFSNTSKGREEFAPRELGGGVSRLCTTWQTFDRDKCPFAFYLLNEESEFW